MTPSSIWITEIGLLSDDNVRKGILSCRDKIRSGDQWPPDLAEFLAMIHGQTDVDYQAAFFRMLNKEPDGRIEQWVYENAQFNIRAMSHEKAERAHKKFMIEAHEKDRKGTLVLAKEEMLALPVHSVVSVTDREHQKFMSEGGKNPLAAKIALMRKNRNTENDK